MWIKNSTQQKEHVISVGQGKANTPGNLSSTPGTHNSEKKEPTMQII